MTTANDATNAAQPETKVPEVPTLRTDDPKLRSFVDAVREILQVREGRRGNPLDANVTYRDLIAAGLAAPTSDGSIVGAPPVVGGGGGTGGGGDGGTGGTGGSGSGGVPPIGPPLPFCATNYDTPPAPTDLAAQGAFSAIVLSWNLGGFQCTAYTEIFRWDTDNLTAAQTLGPIATTGSGFFTDAVGNSRIYYYWVRLVSVTGVVGPFNKVAGTPGQTASDPTYVLGILTGQILDTHLHPTLGMPIQSLFDRYGDTTISDSTIKELIDITDDHTEQISALSTVSVANRTFFQNTAPTNPTAEPTPYPLRLGDMWYDTTAGKNLPSYRWNNTQWSFMNQGVRTFWQPGIPLVGTQGPFNVGDQWFDNDENNKPYIWNGTTWIAHLDSYTAAFVIEQNKTQIGYATFVGNCIVGGITYDAGVVFDNNGAILHYADVVTWNATHTTASTGYLNWHEGLPIALAVKQVGVTIGTKGVAMEQRFVAQAVDNTHFNAMYTLKIDNQGYVTGFGISSENPNGTSWPQSTFEVRADAFAIAPAAAPAWATGTTYAKFERVTYLVDGKVYESKTDGNQGSIPPNFPAKWLDLTSHLPFIVRSISTVVDGITYPAGSVWINAAWIADATIGTAKIKYLNADIINTAFYMSSPKMAGAQVFSEEMYIGPPNVFTKTTVADPVSGLTKVTNIVWNGFGAPPNYSQGIAARMVNGVFTLDIQGTVKSNDFVTGVSGWGIFSQGNAEFNNAVMRGTVYAVAGQIGGTIIEASSIRSSNYTAAHTAGWSINADGTAHFSGISIYNAQGALVFGSTGLPWSSITGVPGTVLNANVILNADGTLNNSAGTGGAVTLSGLGTDVFRVVTSGGSNTTTLPVSPGIYKNGVIVAGAPVLRSYTVVKINRATRVIDSAARFDLFAGAANATAMANSLNATQNDHIVVVFSWDEPQTNRLANGLDAAMYRCGASKHNYGSNPENLATTSFKFRSVYVLVGIPGIGEGNGAEFYAGATDSAANAWADVGFTLQGNALVGVTGATVPANLVSAGNPINTGNISTFISSGAIGNAYIGNFIQSFDFNGVINTGGVITNPGTRGWAIGRESSVPGNSPGALAVFQNIYARGDITATNITADTITVGMIKNDQITNTAGGASQATVDDGGTGSTVLQAVCYGVASANVQSQIVTVGLDRLDGAVWNSVASVNVTVLGVPYQNSEDNGYRASSFSIPIMAKLDKQGLKTYRVTCNAIGYTSTIIGTGMKK